MTLPGLIAGPAPDQVAATPQELDFWRRLNLSLDELLELGASERQERLHALRLDDPALAAEIERVLIRMGLQAAHVSNPVHGPLATAASEASAAEPLAAFDDLLSHALDHDRHSRPSARHPGERCGPWRLQGRLGEGGMGEVWLANRDDGLYEAQVAIKFLFMDVDAKRFQARFDQERSLLARLDHPNIARLLDAGQHRDEPYFVLEYVAGEHLLDYVRRHAPTIATRLRLIEQIAEALSYAHHKLVVHRDIKPSNILVTPEGQIKLLDFGVAGLLLEESADSHGPVHVQEGPATRMAGRGLTLQYAAPELIMGEPSGVACDVYSLGAVAYLLLAGRPPHLISQRSRQALEHAILHTDPARASQRAREPRVPCELENIPPPADAAQLKGDLDAILATALRRDPTLRYVTVEAFLADLRRWRDRHPIAARREDRIYRARLWFQRNWLSASLAALSLLLLLAGLFSTWQLYAEARQEASRAQRTTQFLAELLRNADPDLHGGKPPDALQLLDQAARLAPQRFADDPASELELAHLLASTYRSLSRDADALPLARRAVTLAQDQLGETAAETLRAHRLLAEVLYWNHDFGQSRSVLLPILPKLRASVAPTSWAAFEIDRLDAETECAVFGGEAAENRFHELMRHPALETLDAQHQRWQQADLAARRAVCLSRTGQWMAAYELLQAHDAVFAEAPAGQRKQALYHREFLLSTQAMLGDSRAVESTGQALIRQWQSLAGERSDRIDMLLSILAQFHQVRGDPARAEATYQKLLERVQQKNFSDATFEAHAILGLLETQAQYNRADAASILDKLEATVRRLLEQGSPQLPRFRQQLLRAAIIALTLERPDLAERYAQWATERAKDQAPSSAIRELQVRSQLARSRGDHRKALELYRERLASFDRRGEQKSARRAWLCLALAYQQWLLGEREPHALQGALDRIAAAMPPTLPADDILHTQLHWMRTLFVHGLDSPQEKEARLAMAQRYGRAHLDLPKVLNGLFQI